MKIAFVAKGGSGKSTVSALFTRFLLEQGVTCLAIDADINMHLSGLLGTSVPGEKSLSDDENIFTIKQFIKGDNTRIEKSSQVVKTTPPSSTSGFLYITPDHPLIQAYAVSCRPHGYVMQVGTYEEDGIGESCYHTNLSIFEALMTHTITDERHVCVADMTAGTDAFAGALHAQFDLICLVVEPTRESVSLAKEYLSLSTAGHVDQFVTIVANKVEDDTDIAYIEAELGRNVTVSLPLLKDLKALRRTNASVFDISDELFAQCTFQPLIEQAKKNMEYADVRLGLLHELHRKHAQADYIINRHGDITGQIDTTFSYHEKKYDSA